MYRDICGDTSQVVIIFDGDFTPAKKNMDSITLEELEVSK